MSGSFAIYGTELDYEQNLHHTLNVVNRRCFRNGVRRGLKAQVIAVRELDASQRLHYHLIVEPPPIIEPEPFALLLLSTWRKSRWGYHEADVQPADLGWLAYMLKFKGKSDLLSSIDWKNVHLKSAA
jgi:hypothetical protein